MSERRRVGFTLFEVLAAVAVLGLTVTVLARGAIQGMRYEGDASRRLAASLIADQLLFEVEATLAVGNLPEPGRREPEADDEFLRVVEVAPLELAQFGMAGIFQRPDDRPGAPPGLALQAFPQLLGVTVLVSWTDGITEQLVSRTTFAYDPSEAVAALQAATPDDAAQPPGAPAEPGGEEVE